MELINMMNYYLQLIMVITIVIFAIVAGIMFYFLKIKKISAKSETVDYSTFNRLDSMDYMKFEDIVSEDADSLKSPGMIALGNNIFVAGLSIVGYNFVTASSGERERTMANAITFFNGVEQPIQLRQTVKAVDLSYNIGVYEEARNRLAMEGYQLADEYENTRIESEDYIDSIELFPVYEKKLMDLKKAIRTKEHALDEVDAVISYMKTISGEGSADAQKINQIMFAYEFNPDEYTYELSKEEIYMKAFRELDTKGRAYAEALSRCGCSCKRLSAADLVLLMKKHTSPLSEDLRIEELLNSSYGALFITSDSLVELERERLDEEEYERRLQEFYASQSEELRRREVEAQRLEKKLLDDAYAQALERHSST